MPYKMRLGIGPIMIRFSIAVALNIYEKYAGCRFLVLDAKRNTDPKFDPIHFYKRLGFNVLMEREKGTVPMYLDIWLKDIDENI